MRRIALLAGLCLFACAGSKPKPEESSYCPESRGKYCMTEKVCSFDKSRECFVCQCSSGRNPPMRPPDSSVPSTNGSVRDR